MNNSPKPWRGLWIGVVLALAACAPPSTAVPTPAALPTVTHSPVPIATLPSQTPLALTAAPIRPTAVRPSATPTATPSPTEALIIVESLSADAGQLLTDEHANCQPQQTTVRAVVRSVQPLASVALNWMYEGRIVSRPGIAMAALARAEFVAELGPFTQAGRVLYWVTAEDVNGHTLVSDEQWLNVLACELPSPTHTLPPGPVPTDTPEYGEANSVHALDQELFTPGNTPIAFTLTWTGGVAPYTLDRVTAPRHGVLTGSGPQRVYTPDPGFMGTDSFTFRVLDANDQASTGTITIQVLPPPT